MFDVDLTNATLYPDIDEFFNFSTFGIAYMYIASTLPDLFALAGNFIVLYTSLKYKSFNLNKITVTLLENLAVADLLYIIVGYIPMDAVYFTKTWKLGSTMCALNGYLKVFCGSSEMNLLLSISLYRLSLLRDPFTFAGIRRNILMTWMVAIWVIAAIPTSYFMLSDNVVYYYPPMLSCTSSIYKNEGITTTIMTLVFLIIPMVVLVVANANILVISIRARTRSPSEGTQRQEGGGANANALMTVFCICFMFILSYIPYFIRIGSDALGRTVPDWFHFFYLHVLRINMMVNPIIYTLTNRSFGECVRRRVIGPLVPCVGSRAKRVAPVTPSTQRTSDM